MNLPRAGLTFAWLAAAGLAALAGAQDPDGDLLIPDLDRTRSERLEVLRGRFVTPPGFSVEEVATGDLVGSIVNMTFDHAGRPALAGEGTGIKLLFDQDQDGVYDTVRMFTNDIETAHGMLYIGPGDLLVHSEGPEGTGLYRVTDTDGDDRADEVTLVAPSTDPIAEHGPHTILRGPDGFYYVLFGNHAHPDVELDPASPSRGLQEDHLLPRYLDPRGHANRIRAPGGTIHRLSPNLQEWSQVAAGFRNPFDMAADVTGEIFAYDADMEWDVGLPWFRPTRVAHVIPGGDYGWRTGSSKFPFYYIDTLPSVDDIGRGSPVGVAFYSHHAYPERYRGALFMGDWSRGRIRVLFPKRRGATFTGKTLDFLLGEPLNVTDLDIGPDGFLYFSTGGRSTTGGLYRVRYEGSSEAPAAEGIDRVLDQPMPRSAWGQASLTRMKIELGEDWVPALREAAGDRTRPVEQRLRALEALQVLGPPPGLDLLRRLGGDEPDPLVRAAAVLLLGTRPFEAVEADLARALEDSDPFVVRRAAEAFVRSGLHRSLILDDDAVFPDRLFELLGHEDRFVRYAARMALIRTEGVTWAGAPALDTVEAQPLRAMEGLLAWVLASPDRAVAIEGKLDDYSRASMDEETLLSYLRVLQLALIRFPDQSPGLLERVGPRLLERFPSPDPRVNRELQVVLAYMETPGSIEAILSHLTEDQPQEEQIHTVYALRTIQNGWTPETRARLMDWFDRARTFGGAASMEGYVDALWESALLLLTDEEQEVARARREEARAEAARQAAALAAPADDEEEGRRTALSQMSFQELAEYLEYDPMAYSRGDVERGRKVFYRARCVDCHVFGTEGRGGGPDLSTVVTRFRRQEILESIMYPSRVISDQYTALQVEVEDDVLVGMLADETDQTLTLIDSTGSRLEIQKEDVMDRRESSVSIMPEGLHHALSLRDLVDLVVFLERGVGEPRRTTP